MLSRLDKYSQRYYKMIAYLIGIFILIYSIYIFKLDLNLSDGINGATIEIIELMAIMLYGHNLIYSLITYLILGIISLGGISNSDGLMIILFSFIGITIYLIRIIGNEQCGNIKLGNNALERIKGLLNSKLKLLEIDRLYAMIMLVFSLTILIRSKNEYMLNSELPITDSIAWLLTFVTYLPVFNLVLIACNAKSSLYIRYMQATINGIYLMVMYMNQPDKIAFMFQVSICIIEMITIAYSLYYGNKQRNEGKYIG